MKLDIMREYADDYLRNGKVFLSINHEANEHTVGGMSELAPYCISRAPYC